MAESTRRNASHGLGKESYSGISLSQQKTNAVIGGVSVGDCNGINLFTAEQLAVGENQRSAGALQFNQKVVVAAAGVDNKTVYAVFQKAADRAALTQGILSAVGKEHLISGFFAHSGNSFEQQRGKGAADVSDDTANEHTAAGLEPLCGTVRMVIHLGNDPADMLFCLFRHVLVLTVEKSRNGSFGDAAKLCHLVDGHFVFRQMFHVHLSLTFLQKY